MSFVLNSGERQDVDGGGGTYGYGKGAFFLASRVGTVLIYTRYREGRQLRSRLIASALLSSTAMNGVPYTGRHWWGLPSRDHCEPITDRDAEVTAHRLGLPGFEEEETGTTVVVLDPDLSDPTMPDEDHVDMSVEAAGRYLADASAWNLWPVTLADRAVRLHVSVSAHGVRYPVPSEHDDAVLANFATAYRAALGENGTPLSCMRPRQELGRFSHADTFGAKVTSPAAAELGLAGSPHHVCLMRSPDLVVQYLPGPSKPHPDVGYAAVFKVNDDLDRTFSKSEPPTHDGWIDAQLTGRDATFVRVARRRILEQCTAIAGPKMQSSQTIAVPIGAIAQKLGFLLSGVGGTGASESDEDVGRIGHGFGAPTGGSSGAEPPKHGRGRTSSPWRRTRPVLVGAPFFASHAGRAVLVQKVRVSGPAALRGTASVLTGEGSLETARPAGSAVPQILGWRVAGNLTLGEQVEVTEGGEYELLVTPVVDAALDIAVESVSR
ncbi:hypothetical protein [Micromonospora sp. NBC_01739]|uniref:hypothetical protein n=1 Tax=Micromonospora sp. NBC_01739 TaxID=2975985 RepID=UPI002E0DCA4C|nr:hypothetical protein OIE53_17055 [Micromonospora sp. NBC_01739]